MGALSKREREVLQLLAEGLSGTAIAERLVLSPETIRTHVRNAMAKLDASTRSQAIAIAIERGDLQNKETVREPGGAVARQAVGSVIRQIAAGRADSPLQALLIGLCTLPDIDGGALFVGDEEGLSLRRAAYIGGGQEPGAEVPATIPLGEGVLGRAALGRTASVVNLGGGGGHAAHATTIAAPMLAADRLVGLLCLTMRPSRPARETEATLVQAFASRIGEVLVSGGEATGRRLGQAFERFRVSWAVMAG